jgi:hypothetical protein
LKERGETGTYANINPAGPAPTTRTLLTSPYLAVSMLIASASTAEGGIFGPFRSPLYVDLETARNHLRTTFQKPKIVGHIYESNFQGSEIDIESLHLYD